MAMTEHRRGLFSGVAAYVFWGLSPIFWKALDGVPALQLLAHRVVWAVPLLAVVGTARRRWTTMRRAFASSRTRIVAIAGGTLVAINWGVYVWAVTSGHIVDASFGYFINPLVSVALGVAVLHERLRPAQAAAVGLAVVGVVAMGVIAGIVPWISLTLAFSFGFYGLLKKNPAAAPALEGLFGEVAFVAIPAAGYLVYLTAAGGGSFGGGLGTTVLLVAAGAVTVIPLFLFGAAAQRIPLTTVGLLQYITPTLQLLLGISLYGESIGTAEIVGFGLVWLALAVFTIDEFRFTRSPRARSAAPT
jgi:chloramphenicol-sensitive protein RarD